MKQWWLRQRKKVKSEITTNSNFYLQMFCSYLFMELCVKWFGWVQQYYKSGLIQHNDHHVYHHHQSLLHLMSHRALAKDFHCDLVLSTLNIIALQCSFSTQTHFFHSLTYCTSQHANIQLYLSTKLQTLRTRLPDICLLS